MGAKGGSESFETTMQVCDPFKKRLKGELAGRASGCSASQGMSELPTESSGTKIAG